MRGCAQNSHCYKYVAVRCSSPIFYFIVPPKLTWALQPCDTHLFALFKDKLSTTCQQLAIANGRRRWDILLLLKGLNTSIDDVLNKRSWRKAFDDLGYRGNQINVSTRVLEKVDLFKLPDVFHGIPSLATLTSCFPQRTNIPIGHVFSAVLQADRISQEHAQGIPPGPDAAQPSSSSGSRNPLPHLVRLGSSRCVNAHDDGHHEARAHAALAPPLALVPRLARLGSSQRLRPHPTAHARIRPPLPPPPDDTPGSS